ncbi:ARI3A protein, partial [Polypterus senegalus]
MELIVDILFISAGTPVNRIPIMAKQVLDLYTLYKLVTEKGGLVEVINKKIWREITKGLNLPTSITSAAFTLRTQYMKYLYPYECEKRGLSSPGELQAAIDSNRREGRRQSYGSSLFSYSPVGTPNVLSSPKIQMPTIAMSTPNGGHISQTATIKKEESMHSSGIPNRIAIPVSLAGHHVAAAQAAAAQAAVQAAALEQLREKLEAGEPPEKKMMLMAEEQQRLMQHALQQNLFAMATQLPMNIKINNRDLNSLQKVGTVVTVLKTQDTKETCLPTVKNTQRKMPRVPAHLRERALGMLLGGMRTADVARAINCHVRTVRRLRQRYRETGRIAAQSSSQWKSPDLNPIEHVWDLLDRRVRDRAIPPRNVQELAGALVEEWANISQQELTNLVQSMRRRCTAVLQATDGRTRY